MNPPIYIPEGQKLLFVPESNEFMQLAKQAALSASTDSKHPTGAVIVSKKVVLGEGANISQFHEKLFCVRKVARKIFPVRSGEGYWMCPGCSPKNHAEQTAIRNALQKQKSIKGADLYLWGHYWCCHSCWDQILRAGIANIYLMDGAEEVWG